MKAKFINESPQPAIKVKSEYWDATSPNFPEYIDLCNELIPPGGEAETFEGELLRMITRIQYDYFNNGFGNDRSDESLFLNKHSDTFKPYMKNPENWDKFFNEYKSMDFGYHYEGSFAAKSVAQYLDEITDAIVKYVNLYRYKLTPLQKED